MTDNSDQENDEVLREMCRLCSSAPSFSFVKDGDKISVNVPNKTTVQAIFYDGLPYQGKTTKIFAYLGIPQSSNNRKLPGMVLVHGGGGTAYAEWVRLWNDRGYAALSIAVEGQTDRQVVVVVSDENTSKEGEEFGRNYPLCQYESHSYAGPPRDGIYRDTARKPIRDQWMYHAVSATLLGRSLLASFGSEVDESKIGTMGISWGACVTSTAVGIDESFAFAIHAYGCGNLAKSQNVYGTQLKKDLTYAQLWDPALRLGRTKLPQLWLSWPGDLHFCLACFASCYRLGQGPSMMSLIPRLGHGHQPCWRREEGFAFADSIVIENSPWCVEILNTGENQQRTNDSVQSVFSSARPLQRGYLVSTVGRGFTGNRHWVRTEAALNEEESHGEENRHYKVSAKLPRSTKAWFLNVVDSNGTIASSDYHELP